MSPRRPWSPGDPLPDDGKYRFASDGIPARHQGAWASHKLEWLRQYLPPALRATKRKKGNCYFVDLFAGPGRTVSNRSGQLLEFEGSPLIALHAVGKGRGWEGRFRGLHFCNLDPIDHSLLELRLEAALQENEEVGGRVHHHLEDANTAVDRILAEISSWAYILAFADIEGPGDLAFETLSKLKRRHPSVDLYVLYPTRLGLDRLLAWDPERRRPFEPALDRFFGSTEWRPIVDARVTDRDHLRMRTELKELYATQLLQHWKHVEDLLAIRKPNGKPLYHMLFAYDHEAAGAIARNTVSRFATYDLFEGMIHDFSGSGPGIDEK